MSADVSEKVLLKEIALREARIRLVWRPFFTLLGLAAVVAAMALPADVLSGKETIVNLELALTVTVSVSLAGFGTWIWGNRHRRRADRLDTRNKDLTRDVKELKQRLRDNQLSDRVSR
ncbi:hypothetical protein [Kribbella sp. NPDC051137]|uniref:hypothetical protein n=1 Tax=Kribbella sp. NPDC051137 TaxID=3155045 RepID=UPI003414A673